MYDQEFTLYNLQNVHIPMPNQPDYLMTLKHANSVKSRLNKIFANMKGHTMEII